MIVWCGSAEMFGSIGGNKTGDEEGRLGGGWASSVGAGYRITAKLGVEFTHHYFTHKRTFDTSDREYRGRAHAAMGSVVYHFSTSRAQPYVAAGAGLAHHTNFNRPAIPDRDSNSDFGFGWNAGAGWKQFVSERVYVRAEVRLLVAGLDPGPGTSRPLNSVGFTGGLGYRW